MDDLFSVPVKPDTTPVKPESKLPPSKKPDTVSSDLFIDQASSLTPEAPPTKPKSSPGRSGSPKISKRPEKHKTRGLFDDNASDDDLFESSLPTRQEIPEERKSGEVEKKRLPGAVALFGGLDLFGASGTGSKVERKAQEEEEVVPSLEQKKKDNLFGKEV